MEGKGPLRPLIGRTNAPVVLTVYGNIYSVPSGGLPGARGKWYQPPGTLFLPPHEGQNNDPGGGQPPHPRCSRCNMFSPLGERSMGATPPWLSIGGAMSRGAVIWRWISHNGGHRCSSRPIGTLSQLYRPSNT